MKYLLILLATLLASCTDNKMARSYGGTETIELPQHRQLVNVTWKETDLWILTKQMDSSHIPVTYSLKEKSSFGILQGEIIIKEQN